MCKKAQPAVCRGYAPCNAAPTADVSANSRKIRPHIIITELITQIIEIIVSYSVLSDQFCLRMCLCLLVRTCVRVREVAGKKREKETLRGCDAQRKRERERETETETETETHRETETQRDRDRERQRQRDRNIDRERERQRERETEWQTETERQRQTGRQTDTETDTQADRQRQRHTETDRQTEILYNNSKFGHSFRFFNDRIKTGNNLLSFLRHTQQRALDVLLFFFFSSSSFYVYFYFCFTLFWQQVWHL